MFILRKLETRNGKTLDHRLFDSYDCCAQMLVEWMADVNIGTNGLPEFVCEIEKILADGSKVDCTELAYMDSDRPFYHIMDNEYLKDMIEFFKGNGGNEFVCKVHWKCRFPFALNIDYKHQIEILVKKVGDGKFKPVSATWDGGGCKVPETYGNAEFSVNPTELENVHDVSKFIKSSVANLVGWRTGIKYFYLKHLIETKIRPHFEMHGMKLTSK